MTDSVHGFRMRPSIRKAVLSVQDRMPSACVTVFSLPNDSNVVSTCRPIALARSEAARSPPPMMEPGPKYVGVTVRTLQTGVFWAGLRSGDAHSTFRTRRTIPGHQAFQSRAPFSRRRIPASVGCIYAWAVGPAEWMHASWPRAYPAKHADLAANAVWPRLLARAARYRLARI